MCYATDHPHPQQAVLSFCIPYMYYVDISGFFLQGTPTSFLFLPSVIQAHILFQQNDQNFTSLHSYQHEFSMINLKSQQKPRSQLLNCNFSLKCLLMYNKYIKMHTNNDYTTLYIFTKWTHFSTHTISRNRTLVAILLSFSCHTCTFSHSDGCTGIYPGFYLHSPDD